MATEKPRFSVTFEDELFTQIEDYRHQNRISTRSKAVVQLVEKGIASLLQDKPELSLATKIAPSEDEALLGLYHQLNDEGQSKVVGYTKDLVDSGNYEKNFAAQLGKEA